MTLRQTMTTALRLLAMGLPVFLLFSCTGTLTKTLMTPALDSMQEQSDLELVCEGTPSYLLMIDSLIAGHPHDPEMLTIGAQAYSGYIGAMIECDKSAARVQAMAGKAHRYGTSLLAELLSIDANDDFQSFGDKLQRADEDDAGELFWAAFALVVWVQQQEGAPAAMAWLGKIELLLLKIIELDEEVEMGGAHFLLGGYYGSRPVMFGGDPRRSRHHFQRALEISSRRMLIYQTIYAETYGRLTMNRQLHNALLEEVLDFPLSSYPPNMLANQIAKRKARRLLADGFFTE